MTAANELARGAPGALEKLERLGDPLSLAFASFDLYRRGEHARAAKLRERLSEHELGVDYLLGEDPPFGPLKHHAQLIRGTFDHCEGLKEASDALCWLFDVAPEATVVAFRHRDAWFDWVQNDYSSNRITQDCAVRNAERALGIDYHKTIDDAHQKLLGSLASAFVTSAPATAARTRIESYLPMAEVMPNWATFVPKEQLEALLVDARRKLPGLDARLAEFRSSRPVSEKVISQVVCASTIAKRLSYEPATCAAKARDIVDRLLYQYLEAATAQPTPSCENLWLGLGVERDFEAARQCLYRMEETEERYEFLIMMHLNGQGGPRSASHAKDLLLRARYRFGKGARSEALTHLVQERLAEPTKVHPEVTLCDIALSTPDVANCLAVTEALERQRYEKEVAKLRATLGPEVQTLLDQLEKRAKALSEKDADRIALEWVGGTGASNAAVAHRIGMRERHESRLQRLLVDRESKPVNATELREAEARMTEALRSKRNEGHENMSSFQRLQQDADADVRAAFSDRIQEFAKYQPTLSAVDRLWIAYRDSWIRLLASAYPDRAKDHEYADFVKTRLTQERIEELREEKPALELVKLRAPSQR